MKPDTPSVGQRFKQRLCAGEYLLGTFIKTPHPIVAEVMIGCGFDFLVLDAEHAPFDRGTLDNMIMTCRALGCPAIVRVPAATAPWLQFVLDAGAAGVMVPHVNTGEQARTLVRHCRYGAEGRGFAGTTRAAAYADRSMHAHLQSTPGEISLIAQIEDPQGCAHCAEIAAVDGIDALFVGRADLAVGLGINDFFAADIERTTRRILATPGAATGLYCAPGEALEAFAGAGASLFVVGSEHTAMRSAAAQIRSQFARLAPAPQE